MRVFKVAAGTRRFPRNWILSILGGAPLCARAPSDSSRNKAREIARQGSRDRHWKEDLCIATAPPRKKKKSKRPGPRGGLGPRLLRPPVGCCHQPVHICATN